MDVLSWVSGEWDKWRLGEPRGELRAAFLAGGPAHRDRATMFLFVGKERAPRLVVKVAFTEVESGFLAAEFDALQSVNLDLPPDLADSVPDALGMATLSDRTAIAARMLQGRRLLVPSLRGPGYPVKRGLLRRCLARSFAWTRRLAETTDNGEWVDATSLEEDVERFAFRRPVSTRLANALRSFGRAVGDSGVRWTRSWQHGDLSVGNMLSHRGRLRILDWEHADRDAPPWYDTAFAPVAMVILARRQGCRGTVPEVAREVLSQANWAGSVLYREMGEAWTGFPLPLSWAVTLTAVQTSLRQGAAHRDGEEYWRDYAIASLGDPEFRRELAWLAPDW